MEVNLPRVALVDLGRTTATGARRRLESLVETVAAAGFEPVVVELLPRFRSTPSEVLLQLPATRRSEVVPETLAWSTRLTRSHLAKIEPTTVICVTSRAFHPHLLGPWRTFIDFVDRLSVSYSERSEVASSLRHRYALRILANHQRRFEKVAGNFIDGAFAAGRADAQQLGVGWLPIGVRCDSATLQPNDRHPDTDIGFVGTLDYLPNVEAVRELDRLWETLRSVRPQTTVLIAGARPTPVIRSIAMKNKWELVPNFHSLSDVLSRVKITVAPLTHATGIQNKVIEAAAHGVPQVVSPAAMAGLDADFPVVSYNSAEDWVVAVQRLLDAEEENHAEGEQARTHVCSNYSFDSLSVRFNDLLAANARTIE